VSGANLAAQGLSDTEGIADTSVVSQCLAGDTEAFEVLVTRYQRILFGVALRMLRNYADAGDATQTTLVKVFQKLETYDCRYRFFSWIYRILCNECLNMIRARRPQQPLTFDVAAMADPLAAFENIEQQRRVQAALDALPRSYREVVVLRHYAGRSYAEIGAAVGIPEKTVKSRLHTARQRLARMLVAADPAGNGSRRGRMGSV
jgi:RNA polymerase sigma-70 factor, ECF subfamily